MAKARKTYTLNGVLPLDAQPMMREIKKLASTPRKEAALYAVLKFITTSKALKAAFKRSVRRNPRMMDKVIYLLEEHKKGKK